jgi:outer membrane protein assembly factor BamA
VTGSSDLYLIANTLMLTFTHDAIVPSTTSDINPIGRKVQIRIGRELNKFNGDGEYVVTSTGLQPKYKTVNFTRAELTWKEYLPFMFRNHTLSAAVRGSTIFGPPVDEFFDFYAGGLIGMKGYPYYAIGGNRGASLGLTYRFPLINNIDLRVMQLYFDKLYGGLFADFGDAWTGYSPTIKELKKDAGLELRLESFSFYSYPTRIFFDACYGFDRFDRYVRNQNVTVTYGREWRFYFGITFGFDFD